MKYYTILTQEQKDTPIKNSLISSLGDEQANIVLNMLGYADFENIDTLTMEEASISCRELTDGTYCCAINLSNPIYLPNKCAFKNMNEQQLQLAYSMYGEEGVLDEEQASKLNFKTE